MEKFNSIIGDNPDVIQRLLSDSETLFLIIVDGDFRIVDYNRNVERQIAAHGELSGRFFTDILDTASKENLEIDSDAPVTHLLLVINTNKPSTIPLLASVYPLKGDLLLIIGEAVSHSQTEMMNRMTTMNNEMVNMTRDLQKKNQELREAHSKIKILSGIVPICMHCKEIRDDKGYWNQLETYITEHSEAQFSHGICDKCVEKHYPELGLKKA